MTERTRTSASAFSSSNVAKGGNFIGTTKSDSYNSRTFHMGSNSRSGTLSDSRLERSGAEDENRDKHKQGQMKPTLSWIRTSNANSHVAGKREVSHLAFLNINIVLFLPLS